MSSYGMPNEDYPVVAVPKSVFDAMRDGAKTGYIDVGRTFNAGGQTYNDKGSAMEYLSAAAGAPGAGFTVTTPTQGSPFGFVMSMPSLPVTVIIANGLAAPITKSSDYCNWGNAIGRPVEYQVDAHGNPVMDGAGKPTTISTNSVPGKQTIAGVETYGIGLYRYNQGSIFHGADGALALTSTDPGWTSTFATGWSNTPLSSVGFGAAADLGQYKDLEDFYKKEADTANVSTNGLRMVEGSIGSKIAFHASIAHADGPYVVGASHMVITLVFEPKS